MVNLVNPGKPGKPGKPLVNLVNTSLLEILENFLGKLFPWKKKSLNLVPRPTVFYSTRYIYIGIIGIYMYVYYGI